MSFRYVYRPEKVKHRCSLPGFFATLRASVGTIVECDCGQQYRCDYYDDLSTMDKEWVEH